METLESYGLYSSKLNNTILKTSDMSEYTNVEHPFLEKLREIDWKVIDKGNVRIVFVPLNNVIH